VNRGVVLTGREESRAHAGGVSSPSADKPKSDAGASLAKLNSSVSDVEDHHGDKRAGGRPRSVVILVSPAGVVNGTEVAAMSDDESRARIPTTTVFSRIGPDQNQNHQGGTKDGTRCRLSGDGVNDAVALASRGRRHLRRLRNAVAKGRRRRSATGQDLGVLAEGVMEGRRIFATP